jgi:hypothetical protein
VGLCRESRIEDEGRDLGGADFFDVQFDQAAGVEREDPIYQSWRPRRTRLPSPAFGGLALARPVALLREPPPALLGNQELREQAAEEGQRRDRLNLA